MALALALVEEDLGRDIALSVARNLVVFVRRPGGQSQFSTPLELQATDRQPLRDLQAWAVEHLADDLSVEALALLRHEPDGLNLELPRLRPPRHDEPPEWQQGHPMTEREAFLKVVLA